MARNTKTVIVYFSPSGTTEYVAKILEKKSRESGMPVTMIDLGRERDIGPSIGGIMDAGANTCLYIGSPVYAGHAVPPVMEFISGLPRVEVGYAVPYVTWGAVSSGVALFEVGKALEERGFLLLGAAKIVATHSLMWASDEPLGGTHPDSADDAKIIDLFAKVKERHENSPVSGLPLHRLNYQPEGLRAQLEGRSLEDVKAHFPVRRLDKGRCTCCGLCREGCPVEAIELSPFPLFGGRCVYCLSCVRLCPEKAIAIELLPLLGRIRKRAEELKERPLSEIFL